MKPIIKAKNIIKLYNGNRILNGVNLEIYPQEILVIMGESGAGKTTLLNILGQLDGNYEGEVEFSDEIFESCHIPFPFVFQDSGSLLPWKTVSGNVKMANQKITHDDLRDILESLSLTEHKDKFPYQLSGGMKQRVGIARALVCNSKVVFMDEPFSNLDSSLRKKLQELVLLIRKQRGVSVIFVTHDENEALFIGDRIIRI